MVVDLLLPMTSRPQPRLQGARAGMLDYLISAAATMLVVIDPVGLAPLFIAVTGDLSA